MNNRFEGGSCPRRFHLFFALMSTASFLDHLSHERRYSAHTVEAYGRDIGQFSSFLLEHGGKSDIDSASSLEVRSWVMKLMKDGLSPRSVRRKLSSLRGYFRFAREAGYLDSDPTSEVDSPKMPGRLPEFVDEHRMRELFEAIDYPEGYRGVFDRTILELLYGTGIRLAELLGIGIGDVDLREASLRVLGKRNKERIIPLSFTLVEQLGVYLEQRPDSASDSLLISEKGRPPSRSLIQRRVASYLGKVSTQAKKSPHVLRHTFATHLLDNGADLNAVKEILGHADLSATQVYTHNTIDKLKRVHAQAHPRGGS